MCLNIKKKEFKLCQKVVKELHKDGRTPFQATPIRDNGLLYPSKKRGKVPKETIRGGFIHSYIKGHKNWSTISYIAYAICVEAEGYGNDIASRALYIPALDKTKKKNDNRNVIALKNATSKEDIIKIWPELNGKL